MSISKNLNGTTVIVPTVREVGWGQSVTGILVSICDFFSGVTTILAMKIQKITAVAQISGPYAGISGASGPETVNFNQGYNWRILLSGNTTLSFSNPVDGTRYFFYLKQDGTGGWTITWPANVKWRGGVAPILSTAAGARDVVAMMYHQVDDVYLAEYGLGFA